MADTKISALLAASALVGTEEAPVVQSAANVKATMTQIKTFCSASPTLVTPALGVATGTSIALGGATIGTNALAVTGTSLLNGAVTLGNSGVGGGAVFKSFSGTSANNFITFGGTLNAILEVGSNGLGTHYKLIGDTSGTGGPMDFWIGSTGIITWNSATGVHTGARDTGLARNAAGVLKVTNGSSGLGKILAALPTADPAISGAMWNNAGVLAFSA